MMPPGGVMVGRRIDHAGVLHEAYLRNATSIIYRAECNDGTLKGWPLPGKGVVCPECREIVTRRIVEGG